MQISSSLNAANHSICRAGFDPLKNFPRVKTGFYVIATITAVALGILCAAAGGFLVTVNALAMYHSWSLAPVSVMQLGMGALIFSTLPHWMELTRRFYSGWSRSDTFARLAEARAFVANLQKQKNAEKDNVKKENLKQDIEYINKLIQNIENGPSDDLNLLEEKLKKV